MNGRRDLSGSNQHQSSTCPKTEGEPLPELETAAKGDADDLVPALKGAADELGVKVRIVDADEWDHGDAKGICKYRSLHDLQPVVEAKARANLQILQSHWFTSMPTRCSTSISRMNPNGQSERSKQKPSRTSSVGISDSTRADLRFISLRGRAKTRKQFKSASVESVPPLER